MGTRIKEDEVDFKFEDFEKLALRKKEIKHKKEIVNGELVHIFCYMISSTGLFNNPLERECRGITFDNTGRVLCRPFHKFFNVGEKEQTLPENIVWELITEVVPKIDGSLITPVIINDKVFWKSKKTFYSSVALLVQAAWDRGEEWVRRHEKDIWDCWLTNETPIFELTSPDNKIVINYGEKNKLTLLCHRHNITGQYWIPPEFKNKELSEEAMSKSFSYNNFIEKVKEMEGIEGFCLYSIKGDIFKIKTEWYSKRHRLLSNISYKQVFSMIADESIDDMISELRLQNFEKPILIIERLINEFNDEYFKLSREVENFYNLSIIDIGEEPSRRFFAQHIKSNYPSLTGFLFLMFDGREEHLELLKREYVLDKMAKKYKSQILFMGFENNGKENNGK
jgi:RNA ligase